MVNVIGISPYLLELYTNSARGEDFLLAKCKNFQIETLVYENYPDRNIMRKKTELSGTRRLYARNRYSPDVLGLQSKNEMVGVNFEDGRTIVQGTQIA